MHFTVLHDNIFHCVASFFFSYYVMLIHNVYISNRKAYCHRAVSMAAIKYDRDKFGEFFLDPFNTIKALFFYCLSSVYYCDDHLHFHSVINPLYKNINCGNNLLGILILPVVIFR